MDKMGKHSQNSEMGRKKSEARGMSAPPSVQQVQLPSTVIPPQSPWTPPNANGTSTSHMLNQARGVLYMQHPQSPQGLSQQMINEPVVAISSGPIMHVDNGQYTAGITPLQPNAPVNQQQPSASFSQQHTFHSNIDQLSMNADQGAAPLWLSSMFSSLDIRLQHIENQLTSQNNNWQHVETTLKAQNDTLQTQNTRMLKLEQQMSDLNTLKQTVSCIQNSVQLIDKDVKDVNKTMSEYDNSIQIYSDLCDQVKANQTETDLNVNDLYEKVDTLQSENEMLKNSQIQTENLLTDLQCRSMRENLVFTGIEEPKLDKSEFENTEETLCNFLKSEMNIEKSIPFDRVHRIGVSQEQRSYPRPIVAKFQSFKDREYIRSSAPKTLKGKPFGVREQFPKVIEDRRKKLYPEMKKARRDPNNRVRLVRDKLYINNRQFILESEDEQSDFEADKS